MKKNTSNIMKDFVTKDNVIIKYLIIDLIYL